MRTINVNTITENIKDMCIQANHFLADDMDKAMKHALETIELPAGPYWCASRPAPNFSASYKLVAPVCSNFFDQEPQ